MKNLDLSGHACIILVGSPSKGKSNCIKYLLLKNSLDKFKGCAKYEFGIVFARSSFNDDYNFIPDEYVYTHYDQAVLQKYLEGLEKQIAEGKQVPMNFVVLDDMIGLLNKHDPFLINAISRSRHTNTHYYFAVQHLKTGANTTMREVCTHAIMFSSKSNNTLVSLYENFGQLFEKFEQFKEEFLKTTKEQYHAMLYLQGEDEIDNNYLSYKCPNVSKWDYKLDY